MESFIEWFPILNTCLPLQSSKSRTRTKIIFLKNIFKKSENKKERRDVEKGEESVVDINIEDNEFPVYTNLRNCPCKICEMKNLFQ